MKRDAVASSPLALNSPICCSRVFSGCVILPSSQSVPPMPAYGSLRFSMVVVERNVRASWEMSSVRETEGTKKYAESTRNRPMPTIMRAMTASRVKKNPLLSMGSFLREDYLNVEKEKAHFPAYHSLPLNFSAIR